MKWLDISEELNDEGKQNLKPGDVLMFNFEGSPLHLRIMRKSKGKIWAKRTYLYTPEEADAEIEVTKN